MSTLTLKQVLASRHPSSYIYINIIYLYRCLKCQINLGSILGPILYLLYTTDLPTDENHQTATFDDDTAILAIGNTVEESTLDVKLKWDDHVIKKLQEINLRWSKMYWLTGSKSVISIHNKLLLYNMVIKPIQLWACSSQSNIKSIQTF